MRRSTGQVIERGPDHFLLRVYIGSDGSGKRKYVNRVVRGKRSEAKKVLTSMLRDRDLGLIHEPRFQSLNAYLDHWLKAAAKPRLQARTYEEYERQLNRYVRKPLGAQKLAALTPMMVQDLYGRMLSRGLSARTVRLTHAILFNALKQAVRWRVLAANPAEAVDLPKQERDEMRAMTEEEATRYLSAARQSPLCMLLTVLLTTGLRPSEARALRWSDVDLSGQRVMVRRKVTKANGELMFGEPKTKKSRRLVDLPEGTALLLAAHQRLSELVFDNGNAQPIAERTVVKEHKRVLQRGGIPDVRLYDLRHTHATLLLAAGVHPKIVSERLGHSTIAITLDTYSHVLPGMQAESAKKLDAMLFGTQPQSGTAALN